MQLNRVVGVRNRGKFKGGVIKQRIILGPSGRGCGWRIFFDEARMFEAQVVIDVAANDGQLKWRIEIGWRGQETIAG